MLLSHQTSIPSENRLATHQCVPTRRPGASRHRRRKNPYPRRSIVPPLSEEERMKLGIIKLNAVDSMYREDPQKLFELGDIQGKKSEPEIQSPHKHPHNTHKLNSDKLKKILDATLEDDIVTPPIDKRVASRSKVVWKGVPLDISRHPLYSTLLPEEADVASILRLKPDQYLTIKRVILHESRLKAQFRKTDAQRMCRVDVNKTGKVWDWFHDIGWLGNAHDD
ncbi:hypothetical protein K493DRAFT_11051 [Basidiobolus meristosporus CBS 931.73]|uniref:SWIRM domain-containing protein n=1 Tax=Basidiobolus meristosporus CBS 931.73 TaxID=1314790 RepID=A0A1Y1YJE8_9FUNG|nr:hypothetical protein K493DRAFT_11051 [Basidiobolus meristosporus CBS 931.73]|eukprot:ORX97876.1 hypothetical protein K493DRAFT_11051 [Basidiobolus meristosporus CBS 931.73]